METVWILDGDGEEFVFENEWDIAIPVDLLLDGDRLRITCFPCVEQEVRAWFDRFCADVFSEKALIHFALPEITMAQRIARTIPTAPCDIPITPRAEVAAAFD